jgi:hypothetical protein
MGLRTAVAAALLLIVGATAASAYRYHYAEQLERNLEDRIGSQVMVVDELVRVWAFEDVSGYVRFDTRRFRCAVPASQTEAVAYLREVQSRQAEGYNEPPLVALFATAAREPIWGPVTGGQSQGVASEQILLICDRIERPRSRFWVEGY